MTANLPDFRIAIPPLRASRCAALFTKQRPRSLAARAGLRYQARVGKELDYHLKLGRFAKVEHTPWFNFSDIYGTANCSPDFILWRENEVTIVEVKLTWVEVAIHKLNDLYNPVVSTALGTNVMPLIICRNTTREAPPAKFTLREALTSKYRLLLWPDTGRMIW